LTTLADRTVEREKLSRESESLKESYKTVRAEYEKGRMADQTRASDIVITGRAVAPKTESGLTSPKLILLGAFLGMLFTGGLLALKDMSDAVAVPERDGSNTFIDGKQILARTASLGKSASIASNKENCVK